MPPPRPSPTTSSPNPGTEWDGPLILNALLVVAERYSALKRARFGSETSAVAVRGMCILMALAAGVLEGLPGLAANGLEGGAQGGRGELGCILSGRHEVKVYDYCFRTHVHVLGASAKE